METTKSVIEVVLESAQGEELARGEVERLSDVAFCANTFRGGIVEAGAAEGGERFRIEVDGDVVLSLDWDLRPEAVEARA